MSLFRASQSPCRERQASSASSSEESRGIRPISARKALRAALSRPVMVGIILNCLMCMCFVLGVGFKAAVVLGRSSCRGERMFCWER